MAEAFGSRRLVELVIRKPGLIGARLSHVPRADGVSPCPYVRIVRVYYFTLASFTFRNGHHHIQLSTILFVRLVLDSGVLTH